MHNKKFYLIYFFISIISVAAFLGFKVPYTQTWAMGRNCTPETLWAKTQNQYLKTDFLIKQYYAADAEIKRSESIKLQLLTDLRFAQDTFSAKLNKSSQEIYATGISDGTLVRNLLELERKALETELSNLAMMVQSIPKDIQYYMNCSTKIENELVEVIKGKCDDLYGKARKEGASNRDIITFLDQKKDKKCLY